MGRRKCSLGDQPSALQNAHYPVNNADYHNYHHYQNQFHNLPIPTDQIQQQSFRYASNDTNQHRLRALSAQPPQSLHKFNASIGGTTQEIEQIMALREELGRLHRPLFDGIQEQHKTQKTWREQGRNIMEEAANQSHFNRYRHDEQKKCNKWVEESLANEFASSLNYQEDFHDFKDEDEQLLLWEEPGRVNYSLARTQCRKIGKAPSSQHTFENIKQIIKRQQIEMKEYLEQRTQTDTTDDQNISSNLNNKSSSEEALAGDSTFKFEYANIGGQMQGSFILGGFKLNKSAQKSSQAREILSTSHDTTKLYDDEPPPPRHENHKGINNTFNFTHPIKIQPQPKHIFASAQKNPENVYKPQRKKLSIVSDFKLEELLKEQVKDPQLCPKRSEHLTNQVFLSSTQREKRSHSHPNHLEICANKVQKQS